MHEAADCTDHVTPSVSALSGKKKKNAQLKFEHELSASSETLLSWRIFSCPVVRSEVRSHIEVEQPDKKSVSYPRKEKKVCCPDTSPSSSSPSSPSSSSSSLTHFIPPFYFFFSLTRSDGCICVFAASSPSAAVRGRMGGTDLSHGGASGFRPLK